MQEIVRRHWWNTLGIEEDFQKRLIVRAVTFSIFYVGMTAVLTAFFYSRVLFPEIAARSGILLSDAGVLSIGQYPGLASALAIWVTALMGFSTIFAVTVGIHYCGRLAGPLHRLRQDLLQIASGGPIRQIKLRDGDEFVELADAVNEALTALSRREADLEARADNEPPEGLLRLGGEVRALLEGWDAAARAGEGGSRAAEDSGRVRELLEQIESEYLKG